MDSGSSATGKSPYKGDLEGHIGESWDVSAVPSSPSIVDNGHWTGMSLIDVINQMPNEILGRAVARQYGNQLPLLVKFIDAEKDMSIQVYPDDKMAMRIKGSCHIKIRSAQDEVVLDEGNSCLIPAAIADYDIEPVSGHTLLLDAFIDNRDNGIARKASRFFHISSNK